MISIKAYFEDGNSIITQFRGTFQEAKVYYESHIFELFENKLVKCVKIELL